MKTTTIHFTIKNNWDRPYVGGLLTRFQNQLTKIRYSLHDLDAINSSFRSDKHVSQSGWTMKITGTDELVDEHTARLLELLQPYIQSSRQSSIPERTRPDMLFPPKWALAYQTHEVFRYSPDPK